MLTSRGWWFLLALLGLLAFGLLVPPRGHATLTVICLSLLLWFRWEWFWFALRARVAIPRLWVERELRNERGPVESVWARQTVEVRVRLRAQGALGLPFVIATDRVRSGGECTAGEASHDGAVQPEQSLEWNYRLRCPAAGKLRFDGVSVKLADLQGFFYHYAFVKGPALYRVLPPLLRRKGRTASAKRHNLLPPPGVHRHRRPGSGSELLDLRDYLPGDPPKLIAWKISARRYRLITKEVESEV